MYKCVEKEKLLKDAEDVVNHLSASVTAMHIEVEHNIIPQRKQWMETNLK